MFREYDPHRDAESVGRIWREVGWLEKKEHEQALAAVIESARTVVAEVNGSAECMVNAITGSMRFLAHDLDVSCIVGVTTSRVARKQGIASRLVANALAREALGGMKVALLGIFDQGYYNQLGFGNGAYERWCTFDPADLCIDVRPRVPMRLGMDDWERVHRSRLSRMRRHGACSLVPPQMTRADMLWSDNGFGLGYNDEQSGQLSHHFWCSAKEVEHGPYIVLWMSYRTKEHFIELLALLKSLGDQIHSVKIYEPAVVQLQDLLGHPFKLRRTTNKSEHENRITSAAYWQVRLLDLPGALADTHLATGEMVRFNLSLEDPIVDFLDDESEWHGIAGEYVVTLGTISQAEPGRDASLPTMTASVGAFTRVWLGVQPATVIAWTDAISAPPELLLTLDRVLSLPVPRIDWDI